MNVVENYMTALRGGMPEYVPDYGQACQVFTPSAMQDPQGEMWGIYYETLGRGEEPPKHLKKKDGFGVTWILDEFGCITDPKDILMESVTEWREKFTIPDLTNYDWEMHLKEDASYLDPDKAVELYVNGPFIQMVNAMGFENTLMDMATEDDAVRDFLDALVSFLEDVVFHTIHGMHIDKFTIYDDFANSRSMFMSPDMFRELLLPYEKRLIDCARSADPDMIVELHTCGKCEEVIPDMVEAGINAWQPAQPMNDLEGLKKRFGNRLVFVGAWDNVRVCSAMEMTEEEVRRSVRESIERYGSQGGYVFWNAGVLGRDEKVMQRLAWAQDEWATYGRLIYRQKS